MLVDPSLEKVVSQEIHRFRMGLTAAMRAQKDMVLFSVFFFGGGMGIGTGICGANGIPAAILIKFHKS